MGNFKKIETYINDLFIIEPKVYKDERGFFMEAWNKKDFEEIGMKEQFVQDNHSKSKKGGSERNSFSRKTPTKQTCKMYKRKCS